MPLKVPARARPSQSLDEELTALRASSAAASSRASERSTASALPSGRETLSAPSFEKKAPIDPPIGQPPPSCQPNSAPIGSDMQSDPLQGGKPEVQAPCAQVPCAQASCAEAPCAQAPYAQAPYAAPSTRSPRSSFLTACNKGASKKVRIEPIDNSGQI